MKDDYNTREASLASLDTPAFNQGERIVFEPGQHTEALQEEWSEPEDVPTNQLLPVPSFIPELLPEPLQSVAVDISHRMQCPIDYVAASQVIMLATAVGAGCVIRPKREDDWAVIPNLWGAVVGRPGDLKTPAIDESLRPLLRLVKEAEESYKQAKAEYESEALVYKTVCNGIKHEMEQLAKRQAKSSTISKGILNDKAKQLTDIEEPKCPVRRRYTTDDATVEKLVELLAESPRGILVKRDELSGQLAGWDRDGREQDRAFFLEAWNGNGSFMVDRISRGTIYAPNVTVSLFGSIQPSKLLPYLYGALKGSVDDGFVQRLQLAVFPDSENWKLVDEAPDKEPRENLFKVVKELANANFISYGAETRELDSKPFFRFAAEAQEFFYKWITGLEVEKISKEEKDCLRAHWSKYRSLMPSLALLFHLVDAAQGKAYGAVGLESAERAAAWCDYLEQHARRIYGLVLNARTRAAATLAAKIKQGTLKDGFSLRDVRRKEWSGLSSQELVQDACEELIDLGWLRGDYVTLPFQPKPLLRFLINPKLTTSS